MNIYIIKDANHYKIGKANCVLSRLKSLQTGSSSQLMVVAAKASNDAFGEEKLLHEYLAKSRVRGEWFYLNDLELNDTILRFGFKTNWIPPVSRKSLYSKLGKTITNPVIQHSSITTARNDMSFMEKTIMYYLLYLFREKGEADFYNVSIKALTLIHEKNLRVEDFKPAAKKVSEFVYNIDGREFKLIEAYSLKNGVHTFSLSQDIKPYFFDLDERCTAMSLSTLLLLNSKHSRRMYELLSIMSIGKSTIIKKESLFEYFGIKENEYNAYSSFERSAILKPRQELNKKSEITFNHKQILDGKTVVAVEFFKKMNTKMEKM